MTAIGRFFQRKAVEKRGRQKVQKANSSMKPKRRVNAAQQLSSDMHSDQIQIRIKNKGSLSDLIEVDNRTMKVMKMEVEDLLELSTKTGNTVPVYKVARALLASNRVRDEFTDQPQRYRFRRLMELMNQKASRGKRGRLQEDTGLTRHYAVVNALNRLERSPNSIRQTVSSWGEAKPFLETIFGFSEREDGGEEEKGSEKLIKADKNGASLRTYKAQLELGLAEKMASLEMIPRHEKWKQVAAVTPPWKFSFENEARIQAAEADKESRKSQAQKDIEEAVLAQEKEEEARKRASSLMRPLTDEERAIVEESMYGIGSVDQVIARSGTDSVQRGSMQTLQPGQWVGDEVISYFLLMLSNRDQELCQKDPQRKRCHFFKSFFMTKLLNEGHANPAIEGTYEYRNVKRWSKKVPGKDIFKLDKIVFPINVQQMHWICAVAFMTEKRIQIYDSMGSGGQHYLDSLFQYLQDEHMDKKKSPLPDVEDWILVGTTPDTPRQRNGKPLLSIFHLLVCREANTYVVSFLYSIFCLPPSGFDCGVFTCMAADFLSKGDPLVYSQDHITQCRERIALSIMKGSAIM